MSLKERLLDEVQGNTDGSTVNVRLFRNSVKFLYRRLFRGYCGHRRCGFRNEVDFASGFEPA